MAEYAPGTPRVIGQYVRPFCKCGHRLTVKTAWTPENPGKRIREARFLDPPMCQRALDEIPGLLRARNELEDDLEEMELLILLDLDMRKVEVY
ncbi:zinc finger, GRF-type [Artemisia annua]|uniref:Zinc finger, GRF-type n=1 Tax=Artemisia annua TaxID=35608 RepID=A0A2U1M2U8_ARTAN|nr:zinc finger, GRF-type [Artemisia annua]